VDTPRPFQVPALFRQAANFARQLDGLENPQKLRLYGMPRRHLPGVLPPPLPY
jgi:hypothetical protein